MADKSKVKYDIDNLNNLIKCLKGQYVLEVGIMGSKAKGKHDSKSGLTNAELGTIHEQPDGGEHKMPRRSFLEDSLKLKLKFNSQQFADMRKILFKQIFIKNAPEKFLQDLGAKCLLIIEDGFATNGFGAWKSLSSSSWKAFYKKIKLDPKKPRVSALRKLSGKNILTDTGKLRHSISFRVVKKK